MRRATDPSRTHPEAMNKRHAQSLGSPTPQAIEEGRNRLNHRAGDFKHNDHAAAEPGEEESYVRVDVGECEQQPASPDLCHPATLRVSPDEETIRPISDVQSKKDCKHDPPCDADEQLAVELSLAELENSPQSPLCPVKVTLARLILMMLILGFVVAKAGRYMVPRKCTSVTDGLDHVSGYFSSVSHPLRCVSGYNCGSWLIDGPRPSTDLCCSSDCTTQSVITIFRSNSGAEFMSMTILHSGSNFCGVLHPSILSPSGCVSMVQKRLHGPEQPRQLGSFDALYHRVLRGLNVDRYVSKASPSGGNAALRLLGATLQSKGRWLEGEIINACNT